MRIPLPPGRPGPVLMCLALAFVPAACVEGTSSDPDDDEIVAVAVQPPQATIDVDGSVQLTATVYDGAGRVVQTEVVWASSASSVASVDENGLVRGASLGSTVISASAAGVTGISEVTVRLLGSL